MTLLTTGILALQTGGIQSLTMMRMRMTILAGMLLTTLQAGILQAGKLKKKKTILQTGGMIRAL